MARATPRISNAQVRLLEVGVLLLYKLQLYVWCVCVCHHVLSALLLRFSSIGYPVWYIALS